MARHSHSALVATTAAMAALAVGTPVVGLAAPESAFAEAAEVQTGSAAVSSDFTADLVPHHRQLGGPPSDRSDGRRRRGTGEGPVAGLARPFW